MTDHGHPGAAPLKKQLEALRASVDARIAALATGQESEVRRIYDKLEPYMSRTDIGDWVADGIIKLIEVADTNNPDKAVAFAAALGRVLHIRTTNNDVTLATTKLIAEAVSGHLKQKHIEAADNLANALEMEKLAGPHAQASFRQQMRDAIDVINGFGRGQ